jgi:hypothetical protein
MYDYYLGGKTHFPADRAAAEKVIELSRGNVREAVLENRAFLARVVRYLVRECGIRHFLDIGSGLPTQGNVHEIALDAAPDSQVVYVDNDPVVAAHARALLTDDSAVRMVQADLRDPDTIVKALPEGFVDGPPVGLLMISCLHFVKDEEDPAGLVARYLRALPVGSHVAITHVCSDRLGEIMSAASGVYGSANASFEARPGADIRALFGDLEMVPPGLVELQAWRPDPDLPPLRADFMAVLGGVARKR